MIFATARGVFARPTLDLGWKRKRIDTRETHQSVYVEQPRGSQLSYSLHQNVFLYTSSVSSVFELLPCRIVICVCACVNFPKPTLRRRYFIQPACLGDGSWEH